MRGKLIITILFFIIAISTAFIPKCNPYYVRWPRVRLNFKAVSEARMSLKACQSACGSSEDPLNPGQQLECAAINHQTSPDGFSHHCDIFQPHQLQNVDGYVEADDRYTFYWKYCLSSMKKCSGEYSFTYLSDRYMDQSSVVKVTKKSNLEECLSDCLDEKKFECRSISFNRTDGGCHMSTDSQITKPDAIRLNNNPNFRVDYYENNCYNISESFTFKTECKEDGIRVSVNSRLPYTGALYGLYDFFTCRIEPKESTEFDYWFPSPLVSKNCSDSIRFKGNEMILEVVLSTDGIEPLYFITPDDLTYQAKCPLRPKKTAESTSLARLDARNKEMQATAKALFEYLSKSGIEAVQNTNKTNLSSIKPHSTTTSKPHLSTTIKSSTYTKINSSAKPSSTKFNTQPPSITAPIKLVKTAKEIVHEDENTTKMTLISKGERTTVTNPETTSYSTSKISKTEKTEPLKLSTEKPPTSTTPTITSSTTQSTSTTMAPTTATTTTMAPTTATTTTTMTPTTATTTTMAPTTSTSTMAPTTSTSTVVPTTTTTKIPSPTTTSSTLPTTPISTTSTPASLPPMVEKPKTPIYFDIFHNGQPVEAVVVGTKISLSFRPHYPIQPEHISVRGCQVEPIDPKYDWEHEPLFIIRDSCPADGVGLVCPPSRSDFGAKVSVEAFRYQTTAQVLYSCLIRVCPLAPCEESHCDDVEGCNSDRMHRYRRELSLEDIRKAIEANPKLASQIGLSPYMMTRMAAMPSKPFDSILQDQQLLSLGGEHVVRKRLVVVNTEDQLKYYVRTGDIP